MPEVADDALPPLSEYERYTRTGDLWVVGDPPVAFAIVEDLDANTHVDQLSLDPNWSRRGIGRSLLDHVTGLARAQGRPFVTLTTFVAVPWNAPYYRRLGFDEVPEDEMGPGLRAILDAERRRWTDRHHARVAMRRAATSSPAGA